MCVYIYIYRGECAEIPGGTGDLEISIPIPHSSRNSLTANADGIWYRLFPAIPQLTHVLRNFLNTANRKDHHACPEVRPVLHTQRPRPHPIATLRLWLRGHPCLLTLPARADERGHRSPAGCWTLPARCPHGKEPNSMRGYACIGLTTPRTRSTSCYMTACANNPERFAYRDYPDILTAGDPAPHQRPEGPSEARPPQGTAGTGTPTDPGGRPGL